MQATGRIGVLIETGDPAAADSVLPAGFESGLSGWDDVAIFHAASWTGARRTRAHRKIVPGGGTQPAGDLRSPACTRFGTGLDRSGKRTVSRARHLGRH